jgi:hypothetical protein
MKPVEHYIALVAAMVFVAMQHKEKSWAARILISGASGGLGYSWAPELARMTKWLGEIGAMVVVTGLFYAILDTALALIADRDAIKRLARSRIGGRD